METTTEQLKEVSFLVLCLDRREMSMWGERTCRSDASDERCSCYLPFVHGLAVLQVD